MIEKKLFKLLKGKKISIGKLMEEIKQEEFAAFGEEIGNEYTREFYWKDHKFVVDFKNDGLVVNGTFFKK